MQTLRAKSEHQMRVESFMLRAGQSVPVTPTEPTPKERVRIAKLIMEEAMETVTGLGITMVDVCRGENDQPSWRGEIGPTSDIEYLPDRPFDMVEAVDGMLDTRVVTTGGLSALGVPDSWLQAVVDENNLGKFGPGHSIREDGKLIKPSTHRPPNIAYCLQQLGWKETVVSEEAHETAAANS